MRIIKQSATYVTDTNDAYKKIEQCGRVCYKSEDKITDGSAINFCKAMFKNQHLAMLEHATVYAEVSSPMANTIKTWIESVKTNIETDMITPYIYITDLNNESIISLSFRVVAVAIKQLIENNSTTKIDNIYDFFDKIINTYPELFNTETVGEELNTVFGKRVTENGMSHVRVFNEDDFTKHITATYDNETAQKIFRKHLTHTIIFTTNRGVTHELVRHRPASFAQESTRYCNYSKNKFGGEITVIEPCYFTENDTLMNIWKEKIAQEEQAYFALLNAGATAQQARGLLPHDVKADIVITATEAEWQHIVNLRYHGTTGAPHPQAKEVMGIALPMLTQNTNGRIK